MHDIMTIWHLSPWSILVKHSFLYSPQDSLPGPDSEPTDCLLHHLHPGLHPAQPTAEGGGEKKRPTRGPNERRDRTGGAQKRGVCGFEF